MVSRRNFFTITVIMLVLAFLFQFTGVAKRLLSDSGENQYSSEHIEKISDDAYEVTDDADKKGSYIVYYGKSENYENVLREYCRYRRLNLVTVNSADQLLTRRSLNARMICVTGSSLKKSDLKEIKKLKDKDVSLVFLNMPDVSVIRNDTELARMMGIIAVQADNVELTGIRINDGFLIGGEKYYQAIEGDRESQKLQDFDLNTPWYIVGGGSNVFMDGIIDSEKYKDVESGYFPAIIWGYNEGDLNVFCCQGDYMKDETALGILTAMQESVSPYTLYSIVNSKALVFSGFPSFADENSDEIQKTYSRDVKSTLRDLIWPGIDSVIVNTRFVPTFMMTSFIKDESAEIYDSQVSTFMEFIREANGEVGLDVLSDGQLRSTSELIMKELNHYNFYTARSEQGISDEQTTDMLSRNYFDKVDTILRDDDEYDWKDLLSVSDGKIYLKADDKASEHTFSDDLRMRSCLTALGYLCIDEDMTDLVYPEGKTDLWQNRIEKISSNLETYYKEFESFDNTSLSETGNRASIFLNLKYSSNMKGDDITVKTNLDGENTGYFILDIPGRLISQIDNADYVMISNGVYLISSKSEKITINTEVRNSENRDNVQTSSLSSEEQ